MEPSEPRGVHYRSAESGYFEKRALRRHAGVFNLWGLAVATVISGNFFGWNFGLTAGGFGGLLVALVIAFALYMTLSLCVAEMSPALPHTGGAYSFARTAMGPWGGFITGVAETIVYVGAAATVTTGLGGYLSGLSESTVGVDLPQPVWWLIIYGIFLAINIAGVQHAMQFAVVMAFLSIAALVIFWVGAIPNFDLDNALNIAPESGQSAWFPVGIEGIFFAIPFAAWLFLGIESLPLTAEESNAPERAIPKATLLGMLTLSVAGILTVTLSSGTAPGAAVVGQSTEPLNEGFRTIFGSVAAPLLAVLALIGLLASFHGVIFAYGRNIYSLSRAGYYPTIFSVTHSTRKTPYLALIAGSVVAYGMAALLYFFGTGAVGAALLSMSVFGAVVSYVMQAISFIRLRKTMPHLERPFRNPLGSFGAAITCVLAILMGVALFWNPDNRLGVVGIAVAYLVAVLYFGLVGRHRLVLSPEEEFAKESQEAEEHGTSAAPINPDLERAMHADNGTMAAGGSLGGSRG